jgi:hypothetical protein
MKTRIFVYALLTLMLLNSCSVGGSTGPTVTPVDIAAIQTAAVQTVVAPLTQTAIAVTAPPAVTETPTLTATPAAIQSPTVTSTPTEVICDALTFVSDSTVPDGQTMTAGQAFVKTWKVRNAGTCTWTTGYRLKLAYGSPMSGQTTFLSTTVAPNAETEISITLKAPTQSGTYIGWWILANNNNINFPVRLGVKIIVP